jgi:hypothetical protein
MYQQTLGYHNLLSRDNGPRVSAKQMARWCRSRGLLSWSTVFLEIRETPSAATLACIAYLSLHDHCPPPWVGSAVRFGITCSHPLGQVCASG